MNEWLYDYKKFIENTKLEIEIEMQELKNTIQNNTYTREEKKVVKDFVRSAIQSQFQDIDTLSNCIDEVEILTILLDIVSYLKNLEIELIKLLGE